MKTAPSLMAAATVAAALAGGALLAAEDRMLFEPQQASTLLGLADDVDVGRLWADPTPHRVPMDVRRTVTRAGSGAQERR